jgi:hypothetical protein
VKTALTLLVLLGLNAPALSAQEACGQPPVTVWTVQFFDQWEQAAAKMVANAAFNNTMTLVPVASVSKTGYLVSFAQQITYTDDCPPRAIDPIEKDSAGWHRQVLDTPALAEAFAAAMPEGTPMAFTTLYGGYSAGESAISGRRRGVTHSAVAFPPRGVAVMWFDGE